MTPTPRERATDIIKKTVVSRSFDYKAALERGRRTGKYEKPPLGPVPYLPPHPPSDN